MNGQWPLAYRLGKRVAQVFSGAQRAHAALIAAVRSRANSIIHLRFITLFHPPPIGVVKQRIQLSEVGQAECPSHGIRLFAVPRIDLARNGRFGGMEREGVVA